MLQRILGKAVGVLALAVSCAYASNPNIGVEFVQAKNDANGDPLPDGALARLGSIRWRHSADVSFIAYTHDGKGVLTASQDNVVRLFDRETGKEIRRFTSKQALPANPMVVPAPRAFFSAVGGPRVAMSQDGKTLALAQVMSNNLIQLWEVESGKEIRQLNAPPQGVVAILFSPDDKTLAARAPDRSVHLIETETGKVARQIKGQQRELAVRAFVAGGGGPEAAGMAFSHDGKALATSEVEFNNQKVENYVRISNAENGDEIRKIPMGGAGASAVAYSRDGKVLAIATGSAIELREPDSGKEIRRIDVKATTIAMVFAPDGKSLAAKGRDGFVSVWETTTGNKLHEFGQRAFAQVNPGGGAIVLMGSASADGRDLAYSPDSKMLAVGSGPTLRFWSLTTGKEQSTASNGHRGAVTTVAMTRDGKTLLSRGVDNFILRWDANTGKELDRFAEPSGTIHVLFAPDGKSVACENVNGTVRVLSTADGKELQSYSNSRYSGVNSPLAYSPDGAKLAVRGTDNTIRVFDTLKGGQIRQITLPGGNPNPGGGAVAVRPGFVSQNLQAIAFSPDGQMIASTMNPGVNNFGPRGQPVQTDNTIRIWDVTTGKEVRQIAQPTGRVLQNIAFAPDGRLLAAENADQTISLWEIASGRERRILGETVQPAPGNPGVVFALGRNLGPAPTLSTPRVLAFSPDGSTLVSRAPANGVRVWQVNAGKEIGVFKGHEGAINWVAFAADGKSIASASADTTILVWDVAPLKRVNVELAAKNTDALWADLASDDAGLAARSIESLARAPRSAIPYLREQLKPTPPPDVNKIDGWIADLSSTNFQKRTAATTELERLGELAAPALKKVIDSDTAVETRRRAEAMLEKLVVGTMSAEQLRQVRAIEALEKMTLSDARQILQTLAGGAAGAVQTQHAQAALRRMESN